MNFSFTETANTSQSSFKTVLQGNKIHDVTFKGCEKRDIVGKTDPSKIYKVLDIKFENDEGNYTHTFFEPTEADGQQRESQYGPNPSNVQSMMLLFKHLIDTVNPKLADDINNKKISLSANGWEDLRNKVIDATQVGVGTKCQIKLLNNNKGIPQFPSFFANYNRDGELYMNSNFIGQKLFFTPKELNKIKQMETAHPTPIDDLSIDKPSSSTLTLGEVDPTVDFEL
jgi:hypothetical protein